LENGLLRRLLIAIGSRLPAALLRRIAAWRWIRPLAGRFVDSSSDWIRRHDVIILHGAAAGLRFNAAGANAGYALGIAEPLVQEAVRTIVRPGDVVYDVGANVGFFTVLAARRVGPQGAVIAFEPFPETATAARRNADLNGFKHVTVLTNAAGRRGGTAKLEVREYSTLARLADESTTGPTVDVEVIAIDDLVDTGRVRPPDFVKIDVEGAELGVIEGMRRTITAHRPVILCEMHGTNAAFASLMDGLGYNVRSLESDLPLAAAPWWVHAVATPREPIEARPRDSCPP
jgi:FkbM family methyltransferase